MTRYLYRADDGAELVREYGEGERAASIVVVPIRPPMHVIDADLAVAYALARYATGDRSIGRPVYTRKEYLLVGPLP